MHRYRQGIAPGGRRAPAGPQRPVALTRRWSTARRAGGSGSASLPPCAAFDFRTATAAVWEIVDEANRYVEQAEPWHLARAERAGDAPAGERLDAVTRALVAACRGAGPGSGPFLPDLAARIARGLRRIRWPLPARAGVPPPS